MKCLLTLLFLLAASCSVERAAAKAAEVLDDAKAFYGDAKRTYEEARAAADTDQSGDVSIEEWLAYLAGIVGVGGGGLLARNAKSNARKDVMEAKIAKLEAKAG